MACNEWRDKIERHADGELSAPEMRAVGEHLRTCASCAADLAGSVQLKLAVKAAGKKYSASPEFRRKLLNEIPARGSQSPWWRWAPALATAALVLVVASLLSLRSSGDAQRRTFSEIADLHVATLASASPVDVLSTDRHTVKPWFAGKIPFTFNLPEFGNTPFTLEGGRIAYLGQAPGAQLLFKDGNHRISVFIFQDSAGNLRLPGQGSSREATFNMETWSEQGLRYFAISDVEAADLAKLSELLKAAARP